MKKNNYDTKYALMRLYESTKYNGFDMVSQLAGVVVAKCYIIRSTGNIIHEVIFSWGPDNLSRITPDNPFFL